MTYKEFRGPGFIMEIPTDWYITSSPQFQARFLAPVDEEQGLRRANMAVAMRAVKAGVSVKAVAEETRRVQEAEYPHYTIIEEQDLTQNNGVLFHRVYHWLNEQAGFQVVQAQTFIILGRVLFTLTASRPVDSPRAEMLDEAFAHMARSFRVIPVPPPEDSQEDGLDAG